MNPEFPQEAPSAKRIDAINVICALVETGAIVLDGFPSAIAREPAWKHPMVSFVDAQDGDAGIAAQSRSRKLWSRVLLILSLAAMLGVGVSGGLMYANYKISVLDKALMAASPWSVVDVRIDGILIKNEGQTLLVPVGATLPNGDAVVSVHPENRTIVLESGTLSLTSGQATTKKEVSP